MAPRAGYINTYEETSKHHFAFSERGVHLKTFANFPCIRPNSEILLNVLCLWVGPWVGLTHTSFVVVHSLLCSCRSRLANPGQQGEDYQERLRLKAALSTQEGHGETFVYFLVSVWAVLH